VDGAAMAGLLKSDRLNGCLTDRHHAGTVLAASGPDALHGYRDLLQPAGPAKIIVRLLVHQRRAQCSNA